MSAIGIIPARFASTRFPGKPLAMIHGKPMIQWVYERAIQAERLSRVVVATDDERILTAVCEFGGDALMTRTEHQSGTDRCYEALCKAGHSYDYVINIQGDEPMIDPGQINQLCSLLSETQAKVATLARRINDTADITNPNVVKIVMDSRGKALYFSRSPVPYMRNVPVEEWNNHHKFYKHIGIYGFRAETLRDIVTMQPGTLEKAESLEQLRWLEYGTEIFVALTNFESIAVDTPEDLEKLINII
jgi:3-deoxy-manno-octulosonate cytidylyltransferase (CMP-KDO synthetase)